ncbi:hypothetical protein HYZ97_03645 [Candidatus Pacearchaeota archaeon]|nr:hypothetical protein [Candidatus Pacearchaeota archaeon]
MKEEEYKAKTVHECWTIAFNLAEEYQEKMNANTTDFLILKAKRDTASEIAWRIKHGERKEKKDDY